MMLKLLIIWAASTFSFFPESLARLASIEPSTSEMSTSIIDHIPMNVNSNNTYADIDISNMSDIKKMLEKESRTLSKGVINKVLTTMTCANEFNVKHNNILTIIDYSLPGSEKRLWVFDLSTNKLLFNTYVSHGIKTGRLVSNTFSNKQNSKASSIGVYNTGDVYQGRHGTSLKLHGLDRGFNDNAYNRAIVMHGSWYVNEDFIKKYGRAGRSWGCPALPTDLTKPIINTIKDQSLFVIYYPSDNWLLNSKFLTCNTISLAQYMRKWGIGGHPNITESPDNQEEILFADTNNNNRHDDHEPIIAMTADTYSRVFHTKAPLTRMLRRQINKTEYIALNYKELRSIYDSQYKQNTEQSGHPLTDVSFIIPVIKNIHGYYGTEMKVVPVGKIEVTDASVVSQESQSAKKVYFEAKPFANIKITNQFIRWLGL